MTIHSPPPILTGMQLGDSISVNGTCLTVTKFDGEETLAGSGTFTVGLAPETLRRTNLGQLVVGSQVNLERAMGGGGGTDGGPARFGGHYVQGHVDCVAEVLCVQMDGDSRRMRFAPKGYGSHGLLRYIVEKGFVCVDGASLTVTAVGGGDSGHATGGYEGWFEVMLVAYTQEKIVTAKKDAGESVNIEVDLTGKLIEVYCFPPPPPPPPPTFPKGLSLSSLTNQPRLRNKSPHTSKAGPQPSGSRPLWRG